MLWSVLWTVLNPTTLGVMLLGTVWGILAGILPGIGATQALAFLFPISYALSIENGLLFFVAIYCAAEYGGSIPAILIRTPGTSSSAVTTYDGYPLARRGRARTALMISLVAGVIGGIMSTVVFILAAPALAWVGLQFGPAEMFAVGIFGLSIIANLLGKGVVRALLSALLGLFLATIGTSTFGGYRFTFGWSSLMDGIPVAVLVTGIFAVSEALRELVDEMTDTVESAVERISVRASALSDHLSFRDFRRLLPSMLRGGTVGTIVGIIPGLGATVASFLAYEEEKKWSKRGHEFGTGVEEAVAAPEAANNAVVAGALVPSLALGIPGSAAAALMISVMIVKGVTPGPLLFQDSLPLVLTIFAGLIASNVLMLAVGMLGAIPFAQVARVPAKVLGPYVMALVLTGMYALENSLAHCYMALGIGILGYVLEKARIPTIPLVLGFIMEPVIETNFVRALTIHNGAMSVFFERPIAGVLLLLAIASTVFTYWRERRHQHVTSAAK